MVDTVMHLNPEIRRYYESVKHRSGAGRAHAVTMEKLIRTPYHMLITRQRMKWENENLTERKLRRLSASTNEEIGGDIEA